jgi:hypothetical protein
MPNESDGAFAIRAAGFDERVDRMIRLEYMAPAVPGATTFECRYCDRRFSSLAYLNAHGALRHKDGDHTPLPDSDRGVTVDETARETHLLEQQLAAAEKQSPLRLDLTTAARA